MKNHFYTVLLILMLILTTTACDAFLGNSSSNQNNENTENLSVGNGGYIRAGEWKGYAYPLLGDSEGSMMTPDTFEDHVAGENLGITGTVGPASDYSGFAGMFININQMQNSEPDTRVLQGDGIFVHLVNYGSTNLILYLNSSSGESWGAEIPEGGAAFIAYEEFNTVPWEPSNGDEFTVSSPIESVSIEVPGNNTDYITYDFYLVNIYEQTN